VNNQFAVIEFTLVLRGYDFYLIYARDRQVTAELILLSTHRHRRVIEVPVLLKTRLAGKLESFPERSSAQQEGDCMSLVVKG
jgi:hypothetical protein